MSDFPSRASPNATQDRPRLDGKTVQVLTALQLNRNSSSSSIRTFSDSSISDHPSPSNVAWRSESPSYSSSIGAPIIGRSASSPPVPSPTTPTKSKIYKQSSLKSTLSLRLEPRYPSSLDETRSLHNIAAPLSPIVEQDYFSPERRSMQLPVDHSGSQSPVGTSTPIESDIADLARPSPVYSTFLSRTLNRSMSQNSSRTHISSASMAPSIPPLDLRPHFVLGAPPSRASKTASHPAASTSDANDDTSSLRAESFMTADSSYHPSGEPITSSNYEEDIGLPRGMDNNRSIPRVVRSPFEHGGLAEEGSARLTATQNRPYSDAPTSSSSFLDRRWLKGIAFGGAPILLAKSKAWRPRLPGKSACLLFWLGFIAPWCWLIGGWLLSTQGETRPEGRWRSRRVGGNRFLQFWSLDWLKKRSKGGETHGTLVVGSGYPFVAPSIDSLPVTAVSRSTSSQSVPKMQWRWEPNSRNLDPWVFRCRVAAITCVTIIIVGLIVALVVVEKLGKA